ncbi:hypothetical protein V1506DRAFT_549880 [Lipomyces tetrasporus]
MWAYFETPEYNRPWIMKRTKSRRLIDRDIRCIYIDEKSGIRYMIQGPKQLHDLHELIHLVYYTKLNNLH